MVRKFNIRLYSILYCHLLSLVTDIRVNANSAVAEVIITENDDARGIVEFSSTMFNTTEPNAAGFLTVTRSAGRFGQVCFTRNM